MERPIRLHVAIGVASLAESKRFYARLFDAPPTRETDDQIDWILDSPPVNFSIFHNPSRPIGPEHVGLDCPEAALGALRARMGLAPDGDHLPDPDGVRVELFSSDASSG